MKKFLFAILLGVLIIAGCTQPPSNIPPPATGNTVKISGFAFVPHTITIKTGEAVTWINEDSVQHQIAADPDQPDAADLSSPNINNGASYSYTFSKAGTWTYHCSIHPPMKGTVVVEG